MTTIPGISFYNQNGQADEQFVETFVARGEQLDLLVNMLRRQARGGESEHYLIVGQRGMGKSTLLRRIAIAVMQDGELRAHFIPLRFREEQYNVIALSAFWRNCGESLAEWFDAQGKPERAERIDRAMDAPQWRDADEAGEAFLALCRESGGRPILLVDNLDLILDALGDREQWVLRRFLQRSDGPVVIGAATHFLSQSGNREEAFYEFFLPHLLEPLTETELMRCMRALADRRGEAGALVRQVLSREPERLRTLYALTGGNPRVLALIYQIIERGEGATTFADLEALLDQVTPFYKARVEEYATSQQRAVIDAIALNWDPITSRDIGTATGIEVTTISSHLNRLKKEAFVQEVPTSGARSGYQLAERFLNIWYLMRHGTRRSKQKLRWLTKFLTRLYSPEELGRMATEARDELACSWHPHYREAVIAAYEEVCGVPVVDADAVDVDADDASGHGKEIILLDEVIARFGSSTRPELLKRAAMALVNKGYRLSTLGRVEEGIAAYDEVIDRFGSSTVPELLNPVAMALVNKGYRLSTLGRVKEGIAAYDEVIDRFGSSTVPELLNPVAMALVNKGNDLSASGRVEEGIAAYDEVIDRFGSSTVPELLKQVAMALVNKGRRLAVSGRVEEGIAAYDEVIDRFGSSIVPELLNPVAMALVNKGNRLSASGRVEEGVAAYDEVIDRFGFSTAPELSRCVATALVNKGNIFFDGFGNFEAAESFYRDALDIEDGDLLAKENLAWLCIMTHRSMDAEELRGSLEELDAVGLSLIDAGIALANDNFGAATDHLGIALDSGLEQDDVSFFDDLLRFLRLAEARGYGEKLIGWFEASGNADRYAPVHAAFIASVRGERFLLDVNPEVRSPAQTIHDQLMASRRHQAKHVAAPEKPAPRRGRARKA